MKSILNALFFTILLAACSHQNAFTKFNLNKEQELGMSSLKSSKIIANNKVRGVISAIYLNEVDPNQFNENEYFYIFTYLKDSSEDITLTLNQKSAIKIEKLSNENRFSHLCSIKNEWNRYYLVTFAKEKKDTLKLILQTSNGSKASLVYKKEI